MNGQVVILQPVKLLNTKARSRPNPVFQQHRWSELWVGEQKILQLWHAETVTACRHLLKKEAESSAFQLDQSDSIPHCHSGCMSSVHQIRKAPVTAADAFSLQLKLSFCWTDFAIKAAIVESRFTRGGQRFCKVHTEAGGCGGQMKRRPHVRWIGGHFSSDFSLQPLFCFLLFTCCKIKKNLFCAARSSAGFIFWFTNRIERRWLRGRSGPEMTCGKSHVNKCLHRHTTDKTAPCQHATLLSFSLLRTLILVRSPASSEWLHRNLSEVFAQSLSGRVQLGPAEITLLSKSNQRCRKQNEVLLSLSADRTFQEQQKWC